MATVVNTFPDKSFGSGEAFGGALAKFLNQKKEDKKKQQDQDAIQAYNDSIQSVTTQQELDAIPPLTSSVEFQDIDTYMKLREFGESVRAKKAQEFEFISMTTPAGSVIQVPVGQEENLRATQGFQLTENAKSQAALAESKASTEKDVEQTKLAKAKREDPGKFLQPTSTEGERGTITRIKSVGANVPTTGANRQLAIREAQYLETQRDTAERSGGLTPQNRELEEMINSRVSNVMLSGEKISFSSIVNEQEKLFNEKEKAKGTSLSPADILREADEQAKRDKPLAVTDPVIKEFKKTAVRPGRVNTQAGSLNVVTDTKSGDAIVQNSSGETIIEHDGTADSDVDFLAKVQANVKAGTINRQDGFATIRAYIKAKNGLSTDAEADKIIFQLMSEQ